MQEFLESERDSLEFTRRHLLQSILLPLVTVLVMVLIHSSQVFFDWNPAPWGVFPLQVFGIRGILTSPWIHGSWGHLVSNIIPLFVLLSIMFFFYRRSALRAYMMIYVMTGIMVWIFAREVSHIGASGVVFGLFGFVLFNGIFRRNSKSILLALLVLMIYGSMFLGLDKDQIGVSYESHWAGFFAGIFASFWYKEELEADEIKAAGVADPDEATKRYFLPRAIFEKTKAQRMQEEMERRRLEELRRLENGDNYTRNYT